MSDEIIVQTGVPIPPVDRRPKNQKSKYPLAKMAVGDMFFLPGRVTTSVSSYVSRLAAKMPGRRFETQSRNARQCDDGSWELVEQGGVEGVAVWRKE